jgi:hypothetical protein
MPAPAYPPPPQGAKAADLRFWISSAFLSTDEKKQSIKRNEKKMGRFGKFC